MNRYDKQIEYEYIPYGYIGIGCLRKFLILCEFVEINKRIPSIAEIVSEIGGCRSNAYSYYRALFYLYFPEHVEKMVIELLSKYQMNE